MSEGFFLRETSRINLLVNEYEIELLSSSLENKFLFAFVYIRGDNYNELNEFVRNSSYYSRLPHLPIECVELDGIPDTLPILIEEVYSPTDSQSISLSSQSKTDNFTLQKTPNLSKKHSDTPSASVPSTPRLRSETSKIDPLQSSSIVRQSIIKLPSFRRRTSSNLKPVIALTSEPFVQLTSFRKVDQTFPEEFNTNYFNQRSQSSRLKKQSSRRSLPDVPFQRSTSLSNSHLNLLDSPVIPKFLCTTPDKTNDDDEVFLATDQEQTVDPATFGDSSTKSKILRESYRRKANTEDRRGTRPGLRRSFSTSHHPQPKYFLTQTNTKPPTTTTTPTNEQAASPLESVLNLTLQLEKSSIDDVQRRQTISTHDVNPLLLNGLTDDENHRNLMEKSNGHSSTASNDNKQDDRIQKHSSINSQTIE